MFNRMRLATNIIALAALASIHLAALSALLNPRVSREYKAYYIDKTSLDWHVQHYHSTPEEGIEFSRPGWPDFVEYSFGISKPENFGRWTDTRLGLRAGFEFNRSFNGTVCVVLNAVPSDAMRDRHVTLAFGDHEKDIFFGQDHISRPYVIEFALSSSAERLELRFPAPLPRASQANRRQVGVGLQTMRIFSEPCSELSEPEIQGH
jgi:hypothetical protein